jgi:hypothetical protein
MIVAWDGSEPPYARRPHWTIPAISPANGPWLHSRRANTGTARAVGLYSRSLAATTVGPGRVEWLIG